MNKIISQKLQNEERYIEFLRWAKQNGAIMSEEIQYPCAFGDQGFTGVGAIKDIPPNKVIIAIPNNLIISYQKTLDSELKDLFSKYPQLFDNSMSDDAEFNCLAIYIFYHKLQGNKSFWYPYLNVVDQFTLFEWKNRDIYNIQDSALIEEFYQLQREMEKSWYCMKQIMNPPYFNNITELHKDLYYWSFEFVMTRCFGWSMPTTSLVPLADMLNHSYDGTTYNIINIKNETEKIKPDKYKLLHDEVDLSLLKVNQENIDKFHNYTDHQLKYVEVNQELLNENERKLSLREQINQINLNVLRVWKEKQIWELDFESSSDSEDNDTESDDEIDNFNNISKKEQEQYRFLKGPNNQAQKPTIKQEVQQQIKQQEEQQVNQDYLKCFELLSKNIPQDCQVKINHQIKGKNKDVDNQDEQKSTEQQQNTDSDTESDFEWFSENDNNLYFCITTTRQINAGDQVFTFYGKRTNKFLLLWYGFCIENNKYNSYNFRVLLFKIINKINKVMDEQKSHLTY